MIYIIEGIDRTGKNTLIDGILNAKGYHEVIHFQKPRVLDCYSKAFQPLKEYQLASFQNIMELIEGGRGDLILNRSWIGEAVYGPLYRATSPEFIWNLEQLYRLGEKQVRLILLTEDFEVSSHFVDDGESFDVAKREEEQNLFVAAFRKSIIRDKRIISVTDPALGGFKPKHQILAEALAPAKKSFYVASRASVPARPAMWRDLRDRGANIISSWIDEAGQGETSSMRELWKRIEGEVKGCSQLVLYLEESDLPLKGALVEVGMALSMNKPVTVVTQGLSINKSSTEPLQADYLRTLFGSWVEHPLVEFSNSVEAALGLPPREPIGSWPSSLTS